MRKVKLDFSWKVWSLVVGFFILIGAIGVSYAYGSSNPSVMGHSADEIEGVHAVLLDAPIVVYTAYPFDINVVTHYPSSSTTQGQIATGENGIPENAKEILLYGSINDAKDVAISRYIGYKYPVQTNWKRLVSSYADSWYPNTNSVWLPLDENGKLDWIISGGTLVQEYRIEIHGYRI